ncbi:dehydrogenase [Bhargavaea cecembensis]|uniref:Dehydrogenase n=1 Tax=Bhargavaea cecembensis TaxID=394098 RepID=A0A165GLA4_9BACL|nr:gluconate 2-dehydrogenase subunit 3 family protein [Bhargavaea cecembensis]KZE36835.1 dehydrogenase [Bhargavaea cecembensis]
MADEKKDVSRRDFLKTAGVATGALVGGGVIGGLIGYNAKDGGNATKEGERSGGRADQSAGSPSGRMFFTNDHDFNILSEATERIFPEDDLGPGAIGLGVPYFIDHQLAGAYGNNEKEYMQGPFYAPQATQGYQSRLRRKDIFLQGIHKMEQEAQNRFETSFAELDGDQMDEIITAFQKDEVEMEGVSAAFFFRLLRSAVLEGAYSDPMYGGNKGMEGWKMKGFPGHQAAYIDKIDSEDFVEIDPQSLGGHH